MTNSNTKITWIVQHSSDGCHTHTYTEFRDRDTACAHAAKLCDRAPSTMRRGRKVSVPGSGLVWDGRTVWDGLTSCSVDGYERVFDFDASDLQPGCDIEFHGEDGGVVEAK